MAREPEHEPDRGALDPFDDESSGSTPMARPGQSEPAEHPGHAAGPPPRPAMSDVTPAPVQQSTTPDGIVRISRSLWIGAFVAGLAAIAFIFLSRNTRVDRLTEFVVDSIPSTNAETVESVANVLLWASIIAIGLFIIIQALLLHGISRRHGFVRWIMLVVLVAHIATAIVVDAFVATGDDAIYITLILLVEIALACAAVLTSFLPGSRGWFHPEREHPGDRVVVRG